MRTYRSTSTTIREAAGRVVRAAHATFACPQSLEPVAGFESGNGRWLPMPRLEPPLC